MSTRDGVYIASRAFALYLFCWMLDNVTYLPGRILAFIHHANQRSVLFTSDYFYASDVLTLSFTLVRIIGLGMAAYCLWRCGPRIQTFFAPPVEPKS